MLNDASVLDVRKLMSGKDGRLFVEVDGELVFLAEVNSFSVNMNAANVDKQPVGSILIYSVNTGVSFTLTFTEMVVRDDLILGPLIETVRAGKMPMFTFQGASERWDDQEQRIVFRNCMPEGEFTLMNLTPGEVIERNQSFRINSIPEWLKKLAYESVA